mmetsp:Transcript_49526/g.98606  ORF Transcript_49526/g.98606 Transcript_49526/m.98606 type:complete len:231 (+) Transcript_49526:1381-2073(+)
MPSSASAWLVSMAERNSTKPNLLSADMCTSLTHGFSSSASFAACIVVLKSSLRASPVRPAGKFPTCSRRARRVIAACCCSSAFIIACCCMAAIGWTEASALAGAGVTVLPEASTSHMPRFFRLLSLPSSSSSRLRSRSRSLSSRRSLSRSRSSRRSRLSRSRSRSSSSRRLSRRSRSRSSSRRSLSRLSSRLSSPRLSLPRSPRSSSRSSSRGIAAVSCDGSVRGRGCRA